MLALALLLGAACSDEGKGDGADAASDRPADRADTSVDQASPDTGSHDTGDAQADAGADAGDTAADTAADTASDTAATPVCDGSPGARLIYLNSGGGPLWPTFSFSGAYGHAFFVIDGKCSYWAGESFLKGIRSGVLLPARADQIASELNVAAFARLKGTSNLVPPDASTRTISDGVNAIHCTGDCTLQAPNLPTPPEYQQAFQRLEPIFRDLFDRGTPVMLPIRIIATDPDYDSGPAVAWPLTWSPSEVHVPLNSNPLPSAGRLITSATELTALRQLRQAAADRNGSAFGIKVRDAADKLFSVLPRDEAPAVVVQGLAAVHH